MLYIRVVNTASGARAVQVIYYRNRKRVIYKHIGSAHTDEEVNELKRVAQAFIDTRIPFLPGFQDTNPDSLLHLDKSEFLGVYHTFFHEVFSLLIRKLGFNDFCVQLLLDLVIMRVFEPASKLRSIELLNTYFGIKHRRQAFYDLAPSWLALKEKAEAVCLKHARINHGFRYELLFYDVTTLYFEAFEEDELRKKGFSKDNKSEQPQILVALMVTKEGFSVAYDIFPGNTFEGNTILPVIKKFIERHAVQDFTIVADAAMISSENIQSFRDNNINYIVGARLGNLSSKLFDELDSSINRVDGESVRVKTDNGYLICSFSSTRYRKDKHEMERQIEKAKAAIKTPARNRRLKFVKSNNSKIELNEALIEKTGKLLGLKGYFTNLEEDIASNNTIMERYGELYKIEHAFRISKNDLETRPVFHYKEEPIKLHILICFMALALSKEIELKTGVSIRKFTTECKKVTDARILNLITSKEIRIRAKASQEIEAYLGNLNLSH